MQVAQQMVTPEIVVSEALLGEVLTPYKPHCRYLKRAWVVVCRPDRFNSSRSEAHISIRGEFAIRESCYIADTGHFNAVEFNICYNQLAYTLLATCVEQKLMRELASWSLDEYRRRQLSDFLIVNFSSEFRTSMQSDRFEGLVSIDKSMTRRDTILIKTSSQFQDGRGGFSRGQAFIAIVNGSRHSSNHEALP